MIHGLIPLGVGRVTPTAPIDNRLSASREAHYGLVRGASLYGQAAGGFGRVPALPALQRFAQPANANRDTALTQLYAQEPGLFRRRLAAQFVHRPKVTHG